MSFKKLVEGMSLRERRALHESIKSRVLLEEDAPAISAAPVGSSLKKGGKEIFRKTQQGWKTTVRVTAAQILGLVKPDDRDEVKRGLEKLGQGDEYPIMKGSLIDPGVAGDKGEITFQRDGELFADPRVVPGDVIDGFTSLTLSNADGGAASPGGGSSTAWAVGDALVTIFTDGIVKIEVKDDESGSYRGFEDIFGQGSGITKKIQKAVGKKKPNVLIFKLSDATEGSLMRQMSKSVLRGLDLGKVRFTREKPGQPYTATITGEKRADAVEAILKKMKEDGQAS